MRDRRSAKKNVRGKELKTFHKAIDTPSGSDHVVGIGDLRVIVLKRDEFWFARGLDIDYAAQGQTEREVKRNFERGLKLTIEEHLKTFGNIENLLSPPTPREAFRKLVWQSVKAYRYSQVSNHKLSQHLQELLKYESIRFIRPVPLAA
jgi:hypothetical protein